MKGSRLWTKPGRSIRRVWSRDFGWESPSAWCDGDAGRALGWPACKIRSLGYLRGRPGICCIAIGAVPRWDLRWTLGDLSFLRFDYRFFTGYEIFWRLEV